MANNSYPRAGDRSPSARAQREEYWRRILARQRQSGLNGTNFCKREEIKRSALSWWARELREREGTRRKPVVKKTRPKKLKRAAFVPVQVIETTPPASTSEGAVEIVMRGGHVIRLKPGFDPATLRRAVDVLEGQPC